ncbi:MAG TPA: hypothetical protein VJY62_09350 [Bacteroidia bacterium]|nr:hypothetical protein [Bacteroidia bacterium]
MLTVCAAYAQKSKLAYYFDDPVVVDSASTIIIPTRYNSDFLSSNKIALWGDFYANIIFYNFTSDTYKRLFDQDTYIVGYKTHYYYYREEPKQPENITSKWLFYRVKNVDRNKSGRIDNDDPAILYVTDLHGGNLKSLTTENENVLSIDIFEKQNFALIKIQRDQDNDGDFENSDKDFYYVKLDLTTMSFGNKIEAKQ